MALTSWTFAVAPSTEEYGDDDDEFASNRSDTTVGDREIELKGDQFEGMTDAKLKLNVYDLWALGITTALGGHYYLWNYGLVAGFGSLIIAVFLIASAYGCLVMCMAELSGALPFAGGAYGIARVTLGSLPGYLIAWFDCYQSMFYTMLSVLLLGVLITFVSDGNADLVPLWWLLIYASYLIIHSIGGIWFWRTLKTLSIGSLLLLLMYIFGSIKFANFQENAPLYITAAQHPIERWFVGGALKFFQLLPLPCWMFVGIESLNLASHDAVDPKRDVPRAYCLSYITVVCTVFATIFVACSVAPGPNILKRWFMPQSFGYMLMFDIDYKKAFILGMPALYTSGFSFTYYYGSQVRAMGKSGLINPIFGYDVPYFNTPVPALLFGAVVGFGIGLRYLYYKTLPNENLFSISLLGAILTYFSQFISFIAFRLYYPTIKRSFVSPLGIAGAIYGMLVFGIVLVVLAGLETSIGIIAFAAYVGALLLYYFFVVRHRQVFSEEEKTVLFKAYLMKSNRLKAGRLRVGQARARARYHPSPSHGSGSSENTGAASAHKSDPRRAPLEPEAITTQRLFGTQTGPSGGGGGGTATGETTHGSARTASGHYVDHTALVAAAGQKYAAVPTSSEETASTAAMAGAGGSVYIATSTCADEAAKEEEEAVESMDAWEHEFGGSGVEMV